MRELTVRLRPFEERDLWIFDRFAAEMQFSEPFEWGGFSSSELWRHRFRDEGLLGSSPYFLTIAAADDDSLIGFDYLFSTSPCHRIWAGTEVENVAEQRALERTGLLREGLPSRAPLPRRAVA